jgi:hypothetical protein
MREYPGHHQNPLALRLYLLLISVAAVPLSLVFGRDESAAVVLILMTVVAVIFWRVSRQVAIANEAGLLIRNTFRTWRFTWDEIEDFRVGREMMGLPFGWVVVVLLRNGEVISLDVTARP